jgi:2-polyprenyl-3-methyl-5-hydroxy-6-metoxy-1,4-benzoquinol methylase
MVRAMDAAVEPSTAHAGQGVRDDHFAFGENWRRFLDVVDDARIVAAQESLEQMLGRHSIEGKRFLDVGSGSGLFSLAARRLGAARVQSFDLDPDSVACTRELRRLYLPDDPAWRVDLGSILDEGFVASLGRHDVVYAWGVLHHTGSMWQAIEQAASLVDEGGRLFVALYNDQGARSAVWRRVKRTYNRLPRRLQPFMAAAATGPIVLAGGAKAVARGRAAQSSPRGMSRWRDAVDWVGGYPFEVARPDEVFGFLHERGWALERLVTCGGKLGCNEYVFRRAVLTP